MWRAIKVTLVCPIEIEDDVDVNDIKLLKREERDAVKEDLFKTDYLGEWESLEVEDIKEWEE